MRYAARLAGAPLRRARDLPTDLSGEEAARIAAEFRSRNPRLFKGFKAPGAIVKAVEAAAALPFDAGMLREAELFNDLMASREAAAQIHLFFAERAAAKIPGVSKDVRPLPISAVAVVGAGTMGRGLANAVLNADLPVTLNDLNAEALERAAGTIAETLRAAAQKGRLSHEAAEARVAALRTSPDLAAIAEADLVIEAVFERLDLKTSVFAQIDAAARPGAILASNTSFLDLNAIAAATSRPQDVVGLHFFAPANVMRLLEVVRGDDTSDVVLATTMDLGRRLKKVAVLSGVCDGFIANRLMARRGPPASRAA
jgi:3-hydroxyacyl-CoA dehydrogenase